MHSVSQGAADLGLTFSPARRRGVAVLEDIACPMCVIMRPDHELASRAAVTLDECGACRLIYQDPADTMQPFFGNEMEAFKRTHKPVAVSNTRAVASAFCCAEWGSRSTRGWGSPKNWPTGVWLRFPWKESECPDFDSASSPRPTPWRP